MRKDPPYLCYDCHNKDGAPFDNVSNAPNIYNHFKNGANVSAYLTQSTDSLSCMGCHNKSEMYYPFTENDAYCTNFSIVSHYGSNRTDLVDIYQVNNNTGYCAYCHMNTSSRFVESEFNKNIRHTGTMNCDDCHGQGRLHAGSLTRPVTGGNCTDCHLEGGANTTSWSVINKTGFLYSVHCNITGDYSATNYTQLSRVCWGCHVNYSQQLIEDAHSKSAEELPVCEDCHDNATPLNSAYLNQTPPQVREHQPSGEDIITIDSIANCTICHNKSLTVTPSVVTVKYPRAKNYISHYARQRTDIIVDGGAASNCSHCHCDGGREFATVFAKPANSDITHGVNCTNCHGYGRIHDSSLTPPEASNCTNCHLEGGTNVIAKPVINKTGFMSSVHRNVTGDYSTTNYTQLSRVCWGCHVNYTAQLINATHTKAVTQLPVCEDCHDNATPLNSAHLNQTPPQVREHQPSGEDIITIDSIANCTICHNKSLTVTPSVVTVKYPRAKNYISHYARQRTDMWVTDNNKTITNCSYCHLDGGQEFNSVFIKPDNSNITHGVDCISCHGSGRIHNSSLKLPPMTDGNDGCFNCHNTMNTYQISASSFENSAHKNLKCIDCHLPRQVFEGMIVNMESRTYNFSMPDNIECMNATLDWSGGSTLNLILHAPATDYSGTSINISSPQSGNWTAVVQDVSGDAAFVLTINVSLRHPGGAAKNCEDCHVTSFGSAPLVYKHLTKLSDVPTSATCVLCHARRDSAATAAISAAHYTPVNLLDTKDCLRCHIGVVDGWGNAPDQRNSTRHTFVTRTLAVGKPWKLVDNYSLALIETTKNAAMFTFEKDGVQLCSEIVSVGGIFNYEIAGLGVENTSIVNVTIDQLFTAKDHYVAELSGYVLASHIHRETDNNECYACHDREFRTNMPDGMDYYVLKKDIENVTLARMPVNFKTHENKILNKGEYWDLGENFSLYIADVSLNQKNARLHLYRNGTLLRDDIISEGSYFTHEEEVLERDIDVFGAKLDCVFTGVTQAVTLTDVFLIAGDQLTFDSNTSVLQTNTQLKYLTLDSNITIGKKSDNFHVNTITPGGYSLDCISCHCGDGVAPVKIDIDIFKKGVHVNLNSNATYTVFITDKANLACWACHGNGSASELIGHPKPYLGNHTAKSCISCHGGSLFGAKQIYDHYPGAEISTDATCWDCHSNTYNDSTQNLQAGTSHYSTQDLLDTTECAECHDNQTNGIRWGEAPQVTKHNASNNCTLCHAGEGVTMFHDSGISITRGCENCHIDEQQAEKYNLTVIRTHYPGAPNESANTLKHNDYTCEVCHNVTNETLHTNLEVREYQNETIGYCFPCHSHEGEFPHKSETQLDTLRHGSGIKAISGCDACHTPEGVSKFHTPTYIGKSFFKGAVQHDIDCTACHEEHEERKYQPYEGIQCVDCHSEYGSAHFAGAAIEMADKTTTCSLCHNEEADTFHNLTHIMGDVTEAAYDSCRKCHMDTEPLKMAKNRSLSIIGGTMSSIVSHPSVSNETNIIITCDSCHNAAGENKFHYDLNPMGTVQNPGWKNWTIGNVTGCKDCHTYHGGQLPFNATNMGTTGLSPAGTAHGLAPSCTLCHGGADPISLHTLATTEFIPRLAVTLNPEKVPCGESCYLEATIVLPPLTKVTQAEYFIDELTRDGYGILLEYIVGEAGYSSAIVGAVIDTDDLSLGNHLIYVHVKDSSGKWSKMEVAVLKVEKCEKFVIAEIILREIVPAVIILGFLFFIWRRFK